MTITIGEWKFDHARYDEEADVLYLSIGEPRPAVGEETPEGHVLLFDEQSAELCGVTLVGVRELTSRDALEITLPHREHVQPSDLKPVLAG